MRKTLVAAAALFAFRGSAMAGDLTCTVKDVAGNAITYGFVSFIHNPDPSQGPTYLEAAMMKGGKIFSKGSDAPIWSWRESNGFATLTSRDHPSMMIRQTNSQMNDGAIGTIAELLYRGVHVSFGTCFRWGD
jgi:hypothetical protein